MPDRYTNTYHHQDLSAPSTCILCICVVYMATHLVFSSLPLSSFTFNEIKYIKVAFSSQEMLLFRSSSIYCLLRFEASKIHSHSHWLHICNVMAIDSELEIMTRLPGVLANSNMCKFQGNGMAWQAFDAVSEEKRCEKNWLTRSFSYPWLSFLVCFGIGEVKSIFTLIRTYFIKSSPRVCDVFRHFSILQTQNSRFAVHSFWALVWA